MESQSSNLVVGREKRLFQGISESFLWCCVGGPIWHRYRYSDLHFVDRAVVVLLLAVGSALFVEATGSLLVGEVDLSLETGTASIKASPGILNPVWVE